MPMKAAGDAFRRTIWKVCSFFFGRGTERNSTQQTHIGLDGYVGLLSRASSAT